MNNAILNMFQDPTFRLLMDSTAGTAQAEQRGLGTLPALGYGMSQAGSAYDQRGQQALQNSLINAQTQNQMLQGQKLFKELNSPQAAFGGTGFDIQLANEQYNAYRNAGYSDQEARLKALNDVRASKTTLDPNTGGIIQGSALPPVSPYGSAPPVAPPPPPPQPASNIKDETAAQRDMRYGVVPDLNPVDKKALREAGIKQDVEMRAALPKAKRSLEGKLEQNKILLKAIQDAKAKISPLSTGVPGAILGYIPQSDALDLEKKIDTIKGNLGIDKLTEMKETSKTGASGFGALSENELNLLTSVKGSLDRWQSEEELLSTLDQIEQMVINNEPKLIDAFKQDFGIYGAGDIEVPSFEEKPRVIDFNSLPD